MVLALRDLLYYVSVCSDSGNAGSVGRAEELVRKEAGAGAGDCGVEGAGDEEFATSFGGLGGRSEG